MRIALLAVSFILGTFWFPTTSLFAQVDPCADDPLWACERALRKTCDWYWQVEEERNRPYAFFAEDDQAGYIGNITVEETDSTKVITGTDQHGNIVRGSIIVHNYKPDSVSAEFSLLYKRTPQLHIKEVIISEGRINVFITCPSDTTRNIKVFTQDLSPGSPSWRDKIFRVEVAILDTTITGGVSLTMDRIPMAVEISRVKQQRYLGPPIKIAAFNKAFICEIAKEALPAAELLGEKHTKEEAEQGKCLAELLSEVAATVISLGTGGLWGL